MYRPLKGNSRVPILPHCHNYCTTFFNFSFLQIVFGAGKTGIDILDMGINLIRILNLDSAFTNDR